MYWSRQRLKEMARTALRRTYWKSVIAGIIMLLTITAVAGDSAGISFREGTLTFGGVTHHVHPLILVFACGTAVVAAAVSVAVKIFLLNPAEVSASAFYNKNLYAPAELTEMRVGFEAHYKNIVNVQFYRMLYTFLWTLLFVVPGIIKAYEYRMIPYLLAEHPEMDRKDAFEQSRAMMNGEKWEAFVLDLTFIGWFLLSGVTVGLAGIFYVHPYYYLTRAALYGALKRKMIILGARAQEGTPAGGSPVPGEGEDNPFDDRDDKPEEKEKASGADGADSGAADAAWEPAPAGETAFGASGAASGDIPDALWEAGPEGESEAPAEPEGGAKETTEHENVYEGHEDAPWVRYERESAQASDAAGSGGDGAAEHAADDASDEKPDPLPSVSVNAAPWEKAPGEAFTEVPDEAAADAADAAEHAAEDVSDAAGDLASDAAETAGDLASDAADAVKDTAEAAGDAAADAAEKAADASEEAADAAGEAADAAGEAADAAADTASGAADAIAEGEPFDVGKKSKSPFDA